MDRGGLSGDDGPTHHGLFDISYLRSVPNLVHMVPKDEDELADMMYTAMLHEGPSAIRYPRGTGPGVAVKEQPVALEIGKAEVVAGRADVAIFGLGAMLPEAERLAEMLEARGERGGDQSAVCEAGRSGVRCGVWRAVRAGGDAGGPCAGGWVWSAVLET